MLDTDIGTLPSAWSQALPERDETADGPAVLAVVGPGGTGKSLALTHVRARWTAVGRPPETVPPGPGGPAARARVLDDLHRAPEAVVRRVVGAARRSDAGLVVAYRTWTRAPWLDELREAVEVTGTTLVLGPLDLPDVARVAGRRLGRSVDPAAAAALRTATGGILALVEAVLATSDGDGAWPWERDGVLTGWDPVGRLVDGDTRRARATVLALGLGAPADATALAHVLRCDPAAAGAALDAVRAAGLVDDADRVVPVVRDATLAAAAPERTSALLERVVHVLGESGAGPVDLAHATRHLRLHDPTLAALRRKAARDLVATEPGAAADLLDAAAAAGAPRRAVTVDRAFGAALVGDATTASRLADGVVALDRARRSSRAAQVLGAVLARDGMSEQALDLYAAYAAAGDVAAAQLARLTGVVCGRADGVPAHPPAVGRNGDGGLLGAARAAMTRGMLQSLEGDGSAALTTLLEASALLRARGRPALLPDTPAALAAVVALHRGQVAQARTALGDALDDDQGGPVARPRHLLLLAWTEMLDGSLDRAFGYARQAVEQAPHGLGARDRLLTTALHVGVARRTGDVAGLVRDWPAVVDALVRRPLELTSLLPLGEVVAAAGLAGGTAAAVDAHLEDGLALVARLGQPVLWAVPLHWCGLQRAVTLDDPERVQRHATALVAAARTSAYADTLAVATQTWLRCLTGRVDADEVERSGRRLVAAGHTWDAARLAGQAAARTPDRPTMVRLLALARGLRATQTVAVTPTTDAPAQVRSPLPRLSARELEVARLVVEGRTYREVAERLYISAKTVEHHVARMRQRLGSRSRTELLAELRGLVGAVEGHG